MVKKIDHLGIAVESLEKAIPFYEEVLGLKCEKIEEVPSQRVKTAFFTVGNIHIELLEPTSEDSPIAKFLLKRGEGVHHVAYQTDDIDSMLQHASSKCKLINETPIIGVGGKKVAFLHPKSTNGVLTEFCSSI